jgi:outer membrane protein OmpA-like peptidoglycan-associated protein
VKRYLQNGGVTVPISSRGRGKENPVVQCNDRNREALIDCLAPNRRVELEFARGDAQKPVLSKSTQMQNQQKE